MNKSVNDNVPTNQITVVVLCSQQDTVSTQMGILFPNLNYPVGSVAVGSGVGVSSPLGGVSLVNSGVGVGVSVAGGGSVSLGRFDSSQAS